MSTIFLYCPRCKENLEQHHIHIGKNLQYICNKCGLRFVISQWWNKEDESK